jgi:glutathione peroxidase-family protein
MNTHDFLVSDIDGTPTRREAYKGKWLLAADVASNCGFTPLAGSH